MSNNIENNILKTAVVVRQDLATWQKLNVTAFLVSGIAATVDSATGEPYVDGSANAYLPMFVSPVLCFAATAEQLTTVLEKVRSRGVVPSIYTEELFTTSNDIDNRTAVADVVYEDLNLVGLAFQADRKIADKCLKGISLHN